MQVTWLLPAALAARAGERRAIQQELPPDAASLGAALVRLGHTHPRLLERITDDSGRVRRHVNIFVRGEAVQRGCGLATPLQAGDEIVVLHAVSGGGWRR